MIICIDPGKYKCGLAVLDEDGRVAARSIAPREELIRRLTPLIATYCPTAIVIGRSASGKTVEREINKLDLRSNIIFVSELESSRQARERYWRANPPRGWLRLIPTSLRVPPVPVDDLAAVIIGERYLAA